MSQQNMIWYKQNLICQ